MVDQADVARQGRTRSVVPAVSAKRGLVYPASVFFLLASIGSMGFLDWLINGPGWYGKQGGTLPQGIYLLSVLTGIYLFLQGTHKPVQVNRALPVAVASILLISAAWSADPRTGISQGVLYITNVLGAVGMAQLWDGDELLDLAAKIFAFCAVASLLVIPPPGADFHGIFAQKNVLGAVMSVGVLAGLHALRVGRGSRLRNVFFIGLCAFVVVKSGSTTSILIVLAFFLLDGIGRLYLQGGVARTVGVWLGLLSAGALLFFFANQSALLELLGKDPTLTGRTLFWPYVFDNILNRPFLGWGYFGFWTPFNPIALQIAEAIRPEGVWYVWIIPNAHNGLLEALLEIGFVGTSLFVFLMLRNLTIAVKCIKGPVRATWAHPSDALCGHIDRWCERGCHACGPAGLDSLFLHVGIFV